MQGSIEFSVCLCVYNGRQYIERCVRSILNQSFHDFELIVIDDGSEDGTSEILKNLMNTDARIKYTYQSNMGISISRAKAVDKACGEYICFIDADDYFYENALDVLHEFVLEGYDIIEFQYNTNGRKNASSTWNACKNLDIDDVLKHYIYYGLDIALWIRCYKRKCVKSKFFPDYYLLREDEFALPLILHQARNIIFIENALIFHEMENEESITHVDSRHFMEQRYNSWIHYVKDIPDFLEKQLGEEGIKFCKEKKELLSARFMYGIMLMTEVKRKKILNDLKNVSGKLEKEVYRNIYRYLKKSRKGGKLFVIRLLGIRFYIIVRRAYEVWKTHGKKK